MTDLWGRLPPQQGLVRKKDLWPVVGENAPRNDPAPWRVAITGLVATPQDWALEELAARPQDSRLVDFHCVTRWSKFDMRFGGLSLVRLLHEAAPTPEARFVRFIARSDRNHDTTLTLEDVVRIDPLVALSCENGPIPPEHGGPVRIITPGKYGYKSLKWLERIELLAENRLGYWESGPGYHDGADPWREERYISGNVAPDVRARFIATKRLGGRNLLSVDFSGESLEGLDGKGALLRNCDFRGADLRGADFTGANLSNARLEGADLTGACFVDADVEGAAFDGARLCHTNFTGASLFGVSFCASDGADGAEMTGALITPEQLSGLTDIQRAYALRALEGNNDAGEIAG